jgi:hypothetical protein
VPQAGMSEYQNCVSNSVKMINDVLKYISKSFRQTAEAISIIEIDWEIDVISSLTR